MKTIMKIFNIGISFFKIHMKVWDSTVIFTCSFIKQGKHDYGLFCKEAMQGIIYVIQETLRLF